MTVVTGGEKHVVDKLSKRLHIDIQVQLGTACLLEITVTTMMVVVHHHFATYLCMQERELTPAPVSSAW